MIHPLLWLLSLLASFGVINNEEGQLKNNNTPLEKENISFIGKNNEIFLIYRSNTPKGLRLGIAKADSIGNSFDRISDKPVLF